MADSARTPPASTPSAPVIPIPKATVYLYWPYSRERVEARDVTWEYRPEDSRYLRWRCHMTYLLPRHRRRSGCIYPYPAEVVVLAGWGHPVLPKLAGSVEICVFAGETASPSRDPVFDAWLGKYLGESQAEMIADFRQPAEGAVCEKMG